MREPVATWPRIRVGQDLDRFRVLELTRQRRDPAVDLGTGATRTNLRVHRECEVDWRCTFWQLDNVAGRREDEDLVLIQIQFQEFEKLARCLGIQLQLEHLAEPRELSIEFAGRLVGLFVQPVRRDSVVGGAMHLARANLNFEKLPPWAEHRRVQRLVAVRLWLRDVVLDPLLHRRPTVVNDAERVVALEHVGDDDADREQVVNVFVWAIALLHFFIDRPEMFRSTGDFHLGDPGVGEPLFEWFLHLRNQLFTLPTLGGNEFRERLVRFGLEMLEGKIFELPPHLRHTKTVCKRRVEIACFLRDTTALLGREPIERAHVVQPISQLDQDDTRILRDGQKELAVILDLTLFARRERQVGDLGQSIDDLRDLFAEFVLDVLDRDIGVFDDVMQQPADHGRRVELQIRENSCDFNAV